MQPIPGKNKGFLRQRFEEQKRIERQEKIFKLVRWFTAIGVATFIFFLR